MYYSYEQIGMVCATFCCDDSVEVGQVCLMSGNDSVSIADDLSNFDGVVVSKRGTCAAVAVRGFVTVPYTGETPYPGSNYLLADGLGGVCAATEGKRYLISHVDSINKTVTFLL